jgi:hypothetical protein
VTATVSPWTGRLGPPRQCADCRKLRPHAGRGLCEPCRARHTRAGTLDAWPRLGPARRHRKHPPRADAADEGRVEDFLWLLDGGETFPVAAARVGVCARTAYLYKAREAS